MGLKAMTSLVITDIRRSCCDREFVLVTAIILNGSAYEAGESKLMDERDLLLMESATAQEEMAEIGVHCGDQYFRMKAKKNHGLAVGEAIAFNGMR